MSLKNIELKWSSSYVNLFIRVSDTAVKSISAEIELLIREAPSYTILLSSISAGKAFPSKDLVTKSESWFFSSFRRKPHQQFW